MLRLIEIRKILETATSLPEQPSPLKEMIDNLLIDLVGVPETGRHQVNMVLNKAINGDIKAKTAVVALHEIYNDYQQENQEKNDEKDNSITAGENIEQAVMNLSMEDLYKSGYR